MSLDLKRNLSRGSISTSSGDMLLRIVKESERIFNIKGLSNSIIGDFLCKSLRGFIGASWIEIFFQEDNRLCLRKSLQTIKSVEIDENSLPGYTALHLLPQTINNASTSSFYNNFNIKFDPFILPSKEPVPVSSIACVPISKDGTCRMVLLLFNKLDENNSLSYFTENDLSLIEALGIFSICNLDNYKYIVDLERKLENVKEQNREGTKLINLGIEAVHRRNSLDKCLKVLHNELKLTKNSIHQISQVMQCDGVIFHVYSKGNLKPTIALGMDTYDAKLLLTKTAEYSTLSSKEILNVTDLSSEPLWDHEKFQKLKSLLACPILKKDKAPLGCIEFFRKSGQFSPVDEKYATKIIEILDTLPLENFVPSADDRNSIDKGFGLTFKELNYFSLSPNEMYDYPKIFAEIRRSIRNLLLLDSCTIYIADQLLQNLWTQQSENCDALSQPITKDTLFGYAYSKQQRIVLPDNIPVSDLNSYDKFGIIQPLISSLSLYPVIGFLSVFRMHKPFTHEELDALETASSKIAGLLEALWIYKHEEQSIGQDTVAPSPESSPEIRFRLANYKKGAASSIHYLTDEIDRTNKIDLKPIVTKSNPIYSIAGITVSKIGELKLLFTDIKNKPETALNILAKRLRQLVPCQLAKLYIMDQHEQHLVDILTSNVAKPSGLISLCMQSKEFICLRSSAYENPYFDKHLDSLGGDTQVETFLAVPVIFQERSLGVIAFANASINFGPEDVSMAEFLTAIPREYLTENNENIKDLNDAIHVGRRHKMLQQWCKQVFFVANSMQTKISLVRDILNKLYEEKNFEKLVKAGLEMICAVINAEQAAVAFQENGEFIEYLFRKSKLIKRSHLEDEGLIIKAIEKMRPISLELLYGKENIIVVPYVEKSLPKIVIKAYNKRDETLSCYCCFNKEDEQTLSDFAISMSYSFAAREKGENPEKLKQFIKQHASSLNTHSLISTIRTASQKLLDCDRATVFMIEGKEMIVTSQGMEKEIPGGFRIPIGKGIIGNVAQTGQTENIKDVYEDPRFDPAMDKKTGYRTSTMLCMPVLDTQGKVIAALQMINKKKGYFDESDEETLVIFSEIISSALQNCTLFMHTITERSRILNILNSIGNYIIVFNSEGVMEYSNKSIKTIFGISKKSALNSHYSSWLRENRQLVLDLTSVIQNPQKKIYRKSQKVVSATFKRTRTLPNLTRALQSDVIESYFHYTIVSVQTFSRSETSGVVLILEDASALFDLHMKLEKMHMEVQTMKSSIYGETSLQKCIQKLSVISNSMEDSDTRIYIDEVIRTLKQGNLNKADIFQGLTNIQGISTQAISEYIGLENPENYQIEIKKRSYSRDYIEIIESSIITDLRDINLDPFIIEDHFIYIKAIFQDFDLFRQMDIKTDTMLNFSNKVKDHYSVYDNPFHNFYHGFNVLHATYMLLSSSQAFEYFSVDQIFALFIAALCHDLEHPGRNNIFEINRGSHLALIYNDKSVLENHHSAVTFKLLLEGNSNLLLNFSQDMKKSFRKLVIVSILGTDMARHVEIITTLDTRFKDIEENPLKKSDLDNLASLLIHSADLSHPCKQYDYYQKWSKKVCEEFTLQYKEEVSLGLPPTEIMKDLDRPDVYYANEFGFLNFAIKPLWNCMNSWLNPHINQFIENLNENIKIYQKLKEEHSKSV